jgi:hypothetical protein
MTVHIILHQETADTGERDLTKYYLQWLAILHQQVTDRFREFSSLIYPVLLALGAYCTYVLRFSVHTKYPGLLLAATILINGALMFGAYGTIAYSYAYRHLQIFMQDVNNHFDLDSDQPQPGKGRALMRHAAGCGA